MMTTSYTLLTAIGVLSFASLTGCAQSPYHVYGSQTHALKVVRGDVAKTKVTAILDAYFLKYQYDGIQHQNIFFLACEEKDKCNEQSFTMVWTWDSGVNKDCSKGYDVYETSSGFEFISEELRCRN